MKAKRACWLLVWVLVVTAVAQVGQPAKRYELSAYVGNPVAPNEKFRVHINTVNLTDIECALYEITPNQYESYVTKQLYFSTRIDADWLKKKRMPEPHGTLKKKWTVRIPPRAGTRHRFERKNIVYNHSVDLPGMPHGSYYLKVSARKHWCGIFIPITQIAGVLKATKGELLVHLYHTNTGNPVPGMPLRIYNKEGKKSEQLNSDSNGFVRLNLDNYPFPIVLYGASGKQTFFTRLYNTLVSDDGRWKPYLYTDRPIYRPGQEVHFKTILREIDGQEYRNAPRRPFTLSISDPRGRTMHQTEAVTNAVGSYSGSIKLNKEAPIGLYAIVVELEKHRYYHRFEVAAYRKPEFEITVVPVHSHYIGDTQATFDLQASYFFGMPVQNAKVNYTVIQTPVYPYFVNEEDEEFFTAVSSYPFPNDYIPGQVVAKGTTTTGANGRARIQFRTQPNLLTDSVYRVNVTVQDASGRSENGSGSVTGMRSAVQMQASIQPYFTGKNQPFTLLVTTHDLDKKPLAVPFTAELISWNWSPKARKYDSRTVKTWRGRTGGQGETEMTLSHDEGGWYKVRVTAADERGRRTISEAWIYIWEGGHVTSSGTGSQRLHILPDKTLYHPGETARILIQASKTPTKVWLTLESDRIHHSQFVKVNDADGTIVELPVLPEYKPGVYLMALDLKAGQAGQARTYLRVPSDDKGLTVELIPDKPEYRPGEHAQFNLRTLDPAGNPVPAELSLGVVDAAIYALRPDASPNLFKYYWGKRPCKVSTFIAKSHEGRLGWMMAAGGHSTLANEYDRGRIARRSQREPAYTRTRFEDLALWQAHVMTDEQGRATVELQIPDNLTRWQATALALTEETKVGQTTAATLVRQPLMVRLLLPRFAVQGDKAPFQINVSHHTPQRKHLTVRLTAQVEGSNTPPVEQIRRVQLDANGQAVIQWQPYPAIPAAHSLRLKAFAFGEESNHPEMEDAVEQSLTVLPRARLLRTVKSGIVQGEDSLPVKLPVGADPRYGKLLLKVYVSPVARAMPALEYLRFYPYGCTEQTASGLMGIAFAKRLAQQLQLGSPGWLKDADEQVQTGFMRLSNMQITGGGWGWWQNERNTHPELTAYALIALAEMQASGWATDRETVYFGVRELEAVLQSGQSRTGRGLAPTGVMRRALSNTERAWLVYALSRHGKPVESAAQALYKNRAHLNSLELGLLGLTWIGDQSKRAQVGAIVRLLERRAHRDPHGVFWSVGSQDWFTSANECSAYIVRLLLLHAPHHPLIQPALERLLIHQERGAFSTKESAQLLSALVVYVQKFPAVVSGADLTLQLDGSEPVHLRAPALDAPVPYLQYEIPAAKLTDGDKRLHLRSQQRLTYSVELQSYLPLQASAENRNKTGNATQMHVSRSYYVQETSGKWVPLQRAVKAGETIQVRVKVKVPGTREYLLVEDPFPAGFEYAASISNPNAPREYRSIGLEHYQPMDHHLAVFLYRIHKEHELIYYLRAEASGVRTALPTRLEQMYHPQERATGTPAVLTVRN